MNQQDHATPWWQTLFNGVAVDLWCGYITPEITKAEAGFLEKNLRLAPGSKVLDVPCGSGRHSLALASRGHHVTGVDISDDFLRLAREGQRSAGTERVRLEQRDMRDLPWSREFDAAYCWGNSFGYLEHEENVEFLHALGKALKPGARFIIDTGLIAESALPGLQTRRWYEVGGIHFLIENRYDVSRGRLETQYTFIRDGQVDRRSGSQQVYTLRELQQLLQSAGFTEFESFSSTDGAPFALGSQRLLLVAKL